jgi:hypothetical protein
MIKPRYNPFLVWFFSKYTLYSIRHHFSSVTIRGGFPDQGKAILMIGNHFSWWDGFFAHYLNMKLLQRRFNIMMLEKELKKRMFLNKIGAFSISKGRQDIVQSLGIVGSLLTDRQNLVVYYPQGKFQSLYDKNIRFQRGIEWILKDFQGDEIQVFLYAAMIDYLKNKRPALTFYIDSYPLSHGAGFSDIEDHFNKLYQSAVEGQINSV